ncbi:MAG: hypothetical protein ACTHJP_02180 [Rhodanobacteraceae bacterium]
MPDAASPRRKRWRWLRREAIDLGDVFVQFFAVVIGILLALFINSRVTERQQQSAVSEAVRAIRTELAANRVALHQSAVRLTAMAADMQRSPGNQNQPARWCFQWDGWDGTNVANLTDSAYQTAIATQALSNMPFKQAQLVAQVYGHQHVKQKDFDLIQTKILVAGPQTLDVCITGVLGIAEDEHVLDAQYDPLIGPDKKAWPTPPPNPFASNTAK